MKTGIECKFYRVILFSQLDNYIKVLIKLFSEVSLFFRKSTSYCDNFLDR